MVIAITIGLCLLPAVLLFVELFSYPNPVELMLHTSGDWVLNFLLLTLAVTPTRQLIQLRIPWLTIRRTLGLSAFFYAFFHGMVYAVFEMQLNIADIIADVPQRKFILVGVLSLSLMLPLAITSTRNWQKRLKRRWLQLHKLVYLLTALGILHYFWLVRADYFYPILYALLFALLMIMRIPTVQKAMVQYRQKIA